MFVPSLLMGAALYSLQADPTRAPREAFTNCLRAFVDSSLNQDRKTPAEFTAALPTQCQAQEAAYRQAMIRRDTAARISQAEAETMADEEIQYARENAQENYNGARRE